ncbi:DUF6471 domain-containing protein [Alteromonas flava]|uniref:DUF6471 domain-containing protein n=1 Tax=Alteromonas flava TaxID=2048003 RepID=UPI000C29583F|nr:DUF6471 domain-containing protein [Alteromonas flava]
MTAKTNALWRIALQRVIKMEMSKRDVTYQALSERLDAIGIQQSADNLRNKINKGILGADLLLQIMSVLNVRSLDFESVTEILDDIQQ